MFDVKDYAMLEKYIECGISKIIGKEFVNQDNIDKIVSKVIKWNDKYDPSKGMAYKSYIHMIVKTQCMTIFSKSKRKENYGFRKLKQYAKERLVEINRRKDINEPSMYLSEIIINDKDLLENEKIILEKHYIQSITINKIAEELKLEKKDIYRVINQAILKIKNKYKNLDNLKGEVEKQYGKLID